MESRRDPRHYLPVDAHAHLHRLAAVPAALEAAALNFARCCPNSRDLKGMLLLAQMKHEHVFEALLEINRLDDWAIRTVPGEPQTLILRRENIDIAIVSGRQIRCSDGLEVAALGTCDAFSDGRSLQQTLADARASGATVTIPWGFGKWLGVRGRALLALIESTGFERIFLVDSGNRVRPSVEPECLRQARARGYPVLAGSDPFPFASDFSRLGSFGFLSDVPIDLARPWGALRDWLGALKRSPQLYGRRCGPFRFIVNQFGIRLHNTLGRQDNR